MKTHDQKIAELTFAGVYPHYLAKVIRKGRTESELLEVIKWLSGFTENDLIILTNQKATFDTFFEKATLNPNAVKITGVICGIRIENIENDLSKKVRYMDKLVDELAKGRPMDKILRS